ncbi:hypothetical protein UPYG_G00147160 [Umbra pygmaea]|uniref:Ig-like domain-containing protein n=1 Tax=Umbra pygmaea TaxID=75934 RepID=A0ABD0WWZ6_UMBPY
MKKDLQAFNPKRQLWNYVNIVLIAAGSWAQIVIQTPEVIVHKLSQNATFNCEFIHTPEQQVEPNPILYWHNIVQTNMTRLWPDAEHPFMNRVDVLDHDCNSSNRSILLKNIQWEDSQGQYECKLSYRVGKDSKRTKGIAVKLLIYDSLFLGLHPEDNGTLLCAVNVSQDLRFVLSILHNGYELAHKQNPRRTPLISLLSVSHPLENDKEYECQLKLNSTLILRHTFKQPLETSAAQELFPEPVFLYGAILLVPIIVLLALITTMSVLQRSHSRWPS